MVASSPFPLRARSWIVAFVGTLVLLSLPVHAQDPCEIDGEDVHGPATVVAATLPLEVGLPGVFGNGVTDIGFSEAGGVEQVLILDPFDFDAWSVFDSTLQISDPLIPNPLPEAIFAFSRIPEGAENAGNFYVLDPGLSPANTTSPSIGVMTPDGILIRPFTPIFGDRLDTNLLVTTMDVSPTGDEIVIAGSHRFPTREDVEFYFLDTSFRVTRGPFRMEGRPSLIFRTGICYNSCDTVLGLTTFRNGFQTEAALEYSAASGEYTGRGISLAGLASGGQLPLCIGLDTGRLGERDVLYTYGAHDDAVHAVELEYSTFPGRVASLACSRVPGPDNPAVLNWTSNPLANFDTIAILQDGVLIDEIPASRTNYTVPAFASQGYSEFTVELRLGGAPSEVRSHCVDISTDGPDFVGGADGFVVPMGTRPDPFNPNLFFDLYLPEVQPAMLGMDCRTRHESLADFRLYTLETEESDRIFVRSPQGGIFADETVLLETGGVSRFTGIALIEGGDGPEFALLGRNSDGEFSAALYDSDGLLIQEVNPIDLSGLEAADFPPFLTDWDRDDEGRFVAVDYNNARLVWLDFDLASASMTVRGEAPVPACAIGDCEDVERLPLMGGISVLPSGHYMVAGSTTSGLSINRVFQTTPFSDIPEQSVQFTGFTQGFWDYAEFQSEKFVGTGIGPRVSFGLALTEVHYDDPDTGEEVVEDITFLSLPALPDDLRPLGSISETLQTFVLHQVDDGVNPDYEAEQILDTVITADGSTGELSPSFAGRSTERDFYYYLVNRGDADLSFSVAVLLDGNLRAEFTETLVVPPGRFVYRALEGRDEAALNLQVAGIIADDPRLQILVGARAVTTGPPDDPVFVRGDVNGSGVLEITDPISDLTFQFLGQGEGGFTPVCLDAHDFNDDGAVNISDPIANLSFQFLGTAPPEPPGAEACGVDPTPDSAEAGGELGCENYPVINCP